MDLLGTFSIDWKTPLENLSEVPVINKSGILINLKERQKKMFTSGHRTKQFDCDLNLAKVSIYISLCRIFLRILFVDENHPTVYYPSMKW